MYFNITGTEFLKFLNNLISFMGNRCSTFLTVWEDNTQYLARHQAINLFSFICIQIKAQEQSSCSKQKDKQQKKLKKTRVFWYNFLYYALKRAYFQYLTMDGYCALLFPANYLFTKVFECVCILYIRHWVLYPI